MAKTSTARKNVPTRTTTTKAKPRPTLVPPALPKNAAKMVREGNTVTISFPGYPGDRAIGVLGFFGGKYNKADSTWSGDVTHEVGGITFGAAAQAVVSEFNKPENLSRWEQKQASYKEWKAKQG